MAKLTIAEVKRQRDRLVEQKDKLIQTIDNTINPRLDELTNPNYGLDKDTTVGMEIRRCKNNMEYVKNGATTFINKLVEFLDAQMETNKFAADRSAALLKASNAGIDTTDWTVV